MNDLLSLFSFEHLIVAVIFIIIAIFLFRSIFRITFRIIIITAIVGLIMVVFFGYSPNEVFNKGKQIASDTTSYSENTIQPAIYNGLKNARVVKGSNGTIEFIGDNFEIGQTPQGKYNFHVKSLNLSISQDELAKYLSKDEMQKLLQSLQDKMKH